MIPTLAPTAMAALAALEEWLAEPGEDRRILAIEFAEGWRTTLALGRLVTEHHGKTMADSLAQAAQVVVADPSRIGAP